MSAMARISAVFLALVTVFLALVEVELQFRQFFFYTSSGKTSGTERGTTDKGTRGTRGIETVVERGDSPAYCFGLSENV
jgi:hypothetical protein